MNEQDQAPKVELEISVAGDAEAFASLTDSLQLLVEVAARQGRDWKLIGALLQVIVDMVTATDGDVFETQVGSTTSRSRSDENTAEERRSHGKLLPEFRMRIACVIDSWSDDEAADYLHVGLRQVRRMAQRGDLVQIVARHQRRRQQFDDAPGGGPEAASCGHDSSMKGERGEVLTSQR